MAAILSTEDQCTQKRTPKRKQMQVETMHLAGNARVVRLPHDLCEEIADAAAELAADPNETREISAVLARRYRLDEASVDRIVARQYHGHKRAYHTQRTGLLNTMSMGGTVLRATLEGR